jgi:hypothetical protein
MGHTGDLWGISLIMNRLILHFYETGEVDDSASHQPINFDVGWMTSPRIISSRRSSGAGDCGPRRGWL